MRFVRENLLSPEELAAMVELSPKTLADWRSARKGPCYLRVGRKIWYPKDLVDDWLETQIQEGENVTSKPKGNLALPIQIRREGAKRNHPFGRHRTKHDGSPPERGGAPTGPHGGKTGDPQDNRAPLR